MHINDSVLATKASGIEVSSRNLMNNSKARVDWMTCQQEESGAHRVLWAWQWVRDWILGSKELSAPAIWKLKFIRIWSLRKLDVGLCPITWIAFSYLPYTKVGYDAVCSACCNKALSLSTSRNRLKIPYNKFPGKKWISRFPIGYWKYAVHLRCTDDGLFKIYADRTVCHAPKFRSWGTCC